VRLAWYKFLVLFRKCFFKCFSRFRSRTNVSVLQIVVSISSANGIPCAKRRVLGWSPRTRHFPVANRVYSIGTLFDAFFAFLRRGLFKEKNNTRKPQRKTRKNNIFDTSVLDMAIFVLKSSKRNTSLSVLNGVSTLFSRSPVVYIFECITTIHYCSNITIWAHDFGLQRRIYSCTFLANKPEPRTNY